MTWFWVLAYLSGLIVVAIIAFRKMEFISELIMDLTNRDYLTVRDLIFIFSGIVFYPIVIPALVFLLAFAFIVHGVEGFRQKWKSLFGSIVYRRDR
ncbi:hypothetical protein EMIT07CA2_550070 [Brevibacillus sp. IT-7CA2]